MQCNTQEIIYTINKNKREIYQKEQYNRYMEPEYDTNAEYAHH